MSFPSMPTQVTCPQCHNVFIAELWTIVDVGEDPELKTKFLRGQVNYAKCPQCSTGGILSVPLIYHDPGKELLLTYIPAQLGLSVEQQEQYVGSLVNAVMSRIPDEQRKGYFLQPKSVLTLEGLYDAILEGDGISREVLEAQRSRLKLMNSLLAVVEDDKTLDQLVGENRTALDYEFFLTLSSSIEAHTQDGDKERAQALQTLREKLLARVTPAMSAPPKPSDSYDELIAQLGDTPAGDKWRALVAINRRRLDYGFFQTLTGKIEAAQQSGDQQTAQKLTDLRKRILDEMDAQDKMVRYAEDQASLLIMKLYEAQDVAAAVREHRNEINEVLLGVLARYQAMANAQKDTARAAKLGTILEAALDMLEENLPPESRLINKLLRANYPDGTNAVLEDYRGLLNDKFMQAYDETVKEVDQDLADHLKRVREQIVAKMTILRA